MRIAIIGAGNVGSALGRGWSAAGEQVVFGVPDPADPKYRSLPAFTPPEAAQTQKSLCLPRPGQQPKRR